MKIKVSSVNPARTLGMVTYDRGRVSFSSDAAREIFEVLKNKRRPRPALSTAKTIEIMKSWSNGYIITEIEE